MADRPLRFCDVCGQLDDHPRHVIDGVTTGKPSDEWLAGIDTNGAPVQAIAQLVNPSTLVRHIDCCAAAGCPVCQGTEALTDGHRGDELLAALQSGVLDDFEPPELPAEMMGGADNG